jgi:threonylcarbamoyladenosine tRNA methylthiotransferase MtaB
MDRRYTSSEYAKIAALARDAIPDLALTTDVMAGFPGESEAEFAESLHFIQGMGFARIHIFPYSPRPGTRAARMDGQVPEPLKRLRAQRMEEVAQESQAAFRRRFLEREMGVLWENERDGLWSGLTGNYLRVLTRSTASLANTITPIRLEVEQGHSLWGKIVDQGELEIDGEGRHLKRSGYEGGR